MTTLNKTREGIRNQKKGVCVATALIDAATEFAAVADVAEFVELPENAIVLEASLITTVAWVASSVMTIKIGATAIRVFNMGTTVGNIAGVALTVKADTGVGAKLTGTLSGSASVGTGKARLIVTYVEYDKNTGEYTDYSTT